MWRRVLQCAPCELASLSLCLHLSESAFTSGLCQPPPPPPPFVPPSPGGGFNCVKHYRSSHRRKDKWRCGGGGGGGMSPLQHANMTHRTVGAGTTRTLACVPPCIERIVCIGIAHLPYRFPPLSPPLPRPPPRPSKVDDRHLRNVPNSGRTAVAVATMY